MWDVKRLLTQPSTSSCNYGPIDSKCCTDRSSFLATMFYGCIMQTDFLSFWYLAWYILLECHWYAIDCSLMHCITLCINTVAFAACWQELLNRLYNRMVICIIGIIGYSRIDREKVVKKVVAETCSIWKNCTSWTLLLALNSLTVITVRWLSVRLSVRSVVFL